MTARAVTHGQPAHPPSSHTPDQEPEDIGLVASAEVSLNINEDNAHSVPSSQADAPVIEHVAEVVGQVLEELQEAINRRPAATVEDIDDNDSEGTDDLLNGGFGGPGLPPADDTMDLDDEDEDESTLEEIWGEKNEHGLYLHETLGEALERELLGFGELAFDGTRR